MDLSHETPRTQAFVFLLEESLGKSLQNCLMSTSKLYTLKVYYRRSDNMESIFSFLTCSTINPKNFGKKDLIK